MNAVKSVFIHIYFVILLLSLLYIILLSKDTVYQNSFCLSLINPNLYNDKYSCKLNCSVTTNYKFPLTYNESCYSMNLYKIVNNSYISLYKLIIIYLRYDYSNYYNAIVKV